MKRSKRKESFFWEDGYLGECLDDDKDFLSKVTNVGSFYYRHTYEIIIHSKELSSNAPHFHLHTKGITYNNDICICLEKPEYFIHRGDTNKALSRRGAKDLTNDLSEVNDHKECLNGNSLCQHGTPTILTIR